MIKNLFKRFSRKENTSSLMMTYNRLPVSFKRGDGMKLWDQNDKEYIDALGGIAVCILGHKHPQFTEQVKIEAENVLHTSNLFEIPAQEAVGERICKISNMERVFLCNSGTEANEAALKIARKYGNDNGKTEPIVITANDSFHGRTMGAMSATGNDAIKQGFTPTLSGFEHVPYNDIAAIKAHATNSNVVAVMLEPIQGEAGIIIPDEDYLTKVREVCDENKWLLIMDEVQSGIGRTGKWCAYQHSDIKPDVITFAKALGNGIPIGACAAHGKAANVLQPGNHGTTFGGNPFASTISSKVIDIIEDDDLVAHAEKMGQFLMNSLKLHLDDNEKVIDIRGKGLMLAIELDHAYPDLAQTFLDAGLIINITGSGKVIRLLPPMIIQEDDADQIAQIISRVVSSQTKTV